MKFIAFIGIMLLFFGCKNSLKEESVTIDEQLKKDSCEDSTWVQLGKPRFIVELYKPKFKAENLKFFKISTKDSFLHTHTALSKKEYYACFQNITLNCPPNKTKPFSEKIARLDKEGKSTFYYYSIHPPFESFEESIHSFSTYLYKESSKKISILGLYHYLGQKETPGDSTTVKTASPIGEVSSTLFKDFFTLAKYEEKDSLIIYFESELIPHSSSKDLGSPCLFKRTEVVKYDSGRIDSLIKFFEFVTWDQGTWLDYAAYKNGILITDFEHSKFRNLAQ